MALVVHGTRQAVKQMSLCLNVASFRAQRGASKFDTHLSNLNSAAEASQFVCYLTANSMTFQAGPWQLHRTESAERHQKRRMLPRPLLLELLPLPLPLPAAPPPCAVPCSASAVATAVAAI